MPKAANYTDEEILLALIWTMPNKMTKGQIGRLLGIKSAGQKHWSERFKKLGGKGLLSIDKLDAGDLFFGSPILKYYLTETNLEAIWRQYFINYDERHGLVNDPFLTPFSAGIWNVTSSPEFSRLVGSKFNYHFLCAKNAANPTKPLESIASVSKEKIWKIMDAVLSVGWKTEAYRRKPVLMDTLNAEQKKAYGLITSVYDGQVKAHPADYKKFTMLFEKNFRYYL
ncbi:MAG: hypothetical protein WC263_00585 [Candidatus Micrarchaeia archaeon]|jgi:hypothetical protein